MTADIPMARTGNTLSRGPTSSLNTHRLSARLVLSDRVEKRNLESGIANEFECTSSAFDSACGLTFFFRVIPRSDRSRIFPADQPVPRTDQNSLIAHEQLLEKPGEAASTSISRVIPSPAAGALPITRSCWRIGSRTSSAGMRRISGGAPIVFRTYCGV